MRKLAIQATFKLLPINYHHRYFKIYKTLTIPNLNCKPKEAEMARIPRTVDLSCNLLVFMDDGLQEGVFVRTACWSVSKNTFPVALEVLYVGLECLTEK